MCPLSSSCETRDEIDEQWTEVSGQKSMHKRDVLMGWGNSEIYRCKNKITQDNKEGKLRGGEPQKQPEERACSGGMKCWWAVGSGKMEWRGWDPKWGERHTTTCPGHELPWRFLASHSRKKICGLHRPVVESSTVIPMFSNTLSQGTVFSARALSVSNLIADGRPLTTSRLLYKFTTTL